VIVRPETIIRWHRAGFRAYWRWRSRNRVGRPKVSAELRTLIGEMSRANALWGAPRIHGELLKLGFRTDQSARMSCRAHRGSTCNASVGCKVLIIGILDAMTMRKCFELASAGDGNERYACIVGCPDRQSSRSGD
jgi:hypothetical protein